jgi:hypothetical protein
LKNYQVFSSSESAQAGGAAFEKISKTIKRNQRSRAEKRIVLFSHEGTMSTMALR